MQSAEPVSLSKETAEIFVAVELAADKPSGVVQGETGYSTEQIERELAWLRDERLIHRVPLVDVNLLGLTDFTLYLALKNDAAQPHHNHKLSDLLVNTPSVSWVTRLEGFFNFGVSVRAVDVGEFSSVIDDVLLGIGDIVYAKAFGARRSFSIYGRKFMSPHAASRPAIQLQKSRRTVRLSGIQKRVLDVLSQLPVYTVEALSRRLSMPEGAVREAVEELKHLEIIPAEIYTVDTERLGIRHYKLLLEIPGLHNRPRERLASFCERHPNVFYLAECYGNFDYEIGVQIKNSDGLDVLKEQLGEELEPAQFSITELRVGSYLKHDNYSF
jgi:DNA-binding Lrp family transcriptional regulator